MKTEDGNKPVTKLTCDVIVAGNGHDVWHIAHKTSWPSSLHLKIGNSFSICIFLKIVSLLNLLHHWKCRNIIIINRCLLDFGWIRFRSIFIDKRLLLLFLYLQKVKKKKEEKKTRKTTRFRPTTRQSLTHWNKYIRRDQINRSIWMKIIWLIHQSNTFY